ncbi:glycoside hydrolase family 2 TIM barrel-domain containing protein [Limibacter armeniacum]|uniref:glycoside hydrolase family 2 TIM barrel-domain containing protein n=1 Tax=Limibacter armeniacum TaxID=466084 RepID=UPI002FE60C2F
MKFFRLASQYHFLLFLTIWTFLSACQEKKNLPSPVSNFNQGWEFVKANDTSWVAVTVPHTPKVEPLVVNDQWQGACTYRKRFSLKKIPNEKVWLEFEGVMNNATVSLNGTELIKHKGGYLPFVVDLTKQLKEGENELVVKVLNVDDPTIPPGKPLRKLDFNFYGGIYRDVNLIRKKKCYITHPVVAEKTASGGILIHFDTITNEVANGSLQVHIRNEFDSERDIYIEASLTDEQGKRKKFKAEEIELSAGEDKEIIVDLTVKKPMLWSPADPNLYDLKVMLEVDGDLVEVMEKRIGIRKINLTEKGFLLNDKEIFMSGTNRHQEYPYVGYAISNEANWRDAVKIKNAGFDFVRLSHYPQDESFLDACDELGIIVMDAIPGWQFFKKGEFTDNAIQDIRDMVRRDRNHPSIFFWEVSLNESEMSEAFMERANKVLNEELPFNDTYSAGWLDHPAYDLFIPARQHGEFPFYWNGYKDGKRSVFISEYGDWEYYAQNAGFNQTAFEGLKEEERTSRQLREAGEVRLKQQALNFQEAANSNLKGKGMGTIGMSNWLMFDYNRGYADDLETSGVSDIFRLPKFAYYFYKSQRPADVDIKHSLAEKGPMLKIASFWNNKSDSIVRVFSNCEEVELYHNGKFIARKKPEINELNDRLISPPFDFNLGKYIHGVIVANGYIDGEKVIQEEINTAGLVTDLDVSIDYSGIPLSTEDPDIVFVYAKGVDEYGYFNERFDEEVTFELEGKGELIGNNPVKAKAGIATILYKSVPGDTTFNISAKSKWMYGTLKEIDH